MVSRLLFAGLLLLADTALAQAPDLQPKGDHADTCAAMLGAHVATDPGPGPLTPAGLPVPAPPPMAPAAPASPRPVKPRPPYSALRLHPFARAPPRTS